MFFASIWGNSPDGSTARTRVNVARKVCQCWQTFAPDGDGSRCRYGRRCGCDGNGVHLGLRIQTNQVLFRKFKMANGHGGGRRGGGGGGGAGGGRRAKGRAWRRGEPIP